MTELLQKAVAETQSLPPDEQDFIAAMLLDNIRYARVWIEPTDQSPHDEFFEAMERFEPEAGVEPVVVVGADDYSGKRPTMFSRFHKAAQHAIDGRTSARVA